MCPSRVRGNYGLVTIRVRIIQNLQRSVAYGEQFNATCNHKANTVCLFESAQHAETGTFLRLMDRVQTVRN